MGPIGRCSIAASVVAVSACSLITPLDGYSAGSPDAGASTATDAGASDARDAAPVETAEAGADAGADAGAFCASIGRPVLLCADYEDGALPGPFDEARRENGGTLLVDTSASVSAPGSLLSRIKKMGASPAGGCLRRKLVGPFRTVNLDFDIRVDGPLGKERYDFVNFERSTQHEVGLQVRETGEVEIDEDVPGPNGTEVQVITPTNGRLTSDWTHVRWTIDVTQAEAASVIGVGGAETAHKGRPEPFGSTLTFEFGDCSYAEEVGGWQVRFDNLVLDGQR